MLFVFPLFGATSADGCASSEPPSKCGAASCPTGQLLVCGTTCVAPVAPGSVCSLNLCATNGTCDQGATCVPTSSTAGVCTKLATQEGNSTTVLASQCDLGTTAAGVAYDECANDLYCRDVQRCDTRADVINGVTTRCAVPMSEGSTCDSNIATFNASTKCFPCGPGLTCATLATNDKRCVRSCTTDNDCPCEGGRAICATVPGVSSKVCALRSGFGETCNGYNRCTDSNLQCGSDGNVGTCCVAKSWPCQAPSDCCAASTTDVTNPVVCGGTTGNKICHACVGSGETCYDTSDCCEGGVCDPQLHQCRYSCTQQAGKSCNVPGQEGTCKLGQWDCDAQNKPICKQTVFPQTDTECDDVDSDCDGKPDYKLFGGQAKWGPCQEAPSGCQAGFKGSGFWLCDQVNGNHSKKVCHINQDSYCKGCGWDGDDKACGQCFAGCTPNVTVCGINAKCANTAPQGQPPNYQCVHRSGCVDPACYPRNSPYLEQNTSCAPQ